MSDNKCSAKYCRAFEPGGCRFSVVDDQSEDIESLLAGAAENPVWQDFVNTKSTGKHAHEIFKVRVSGCVNGCSMPQIADVGIMAVQRPKLEAGECIGCETCVQACPDDAIKMVDALPVIDPDLCLDCGRCVQSCPSDALSLGETGFKVSVGGRLGRHPKLGRDLGGIFTAAQAAKILENCLVLYALNHKPGLRFGPMADSATDDEILKGI